MPIIKSAVKRMRQTEKRRERNVGIKKNIKSAVKAFLAKPTADGLSAAQSEIDTAVKKKLIKKGTAARRKASLSKVAKDAGVKLSAKKPAKKPVAKATPAKKPAAKTTAAKKPAPKTAKPTTKKPATKKAPAKKPAAKK